MLNYFFSKWLIVIEIFLTLIKFGPEIPIFSELFDFDHREKCIATNYVEYYQKYYCQLIFSNLSAFEICCQILKIFWVNRILTIFFMSFLRFLFLILSTNEVYGYILGIKLPQWSFFQIIKDSLRAKQLWIAHLGHNFFLLQHLKSKCCWTFSKSLQHDFATFQKASKSL